MRVEVGCYENRLDAGRGEGCEGDDSQRPRGALDARDAHHGIPYHHPLVVGVVEDDIEVVLVCDLPPNDTNPGRVRKGDGDWRRRDDEVQRLPRRPATRRRGSGVVDAVVALALRTTSRSPTLLTVIMTMLIKAYLMQIPTAPRHLSTRDSPKSNA